MTERWRSEVSCVTMPICVAQGFLGHLRNVLAIDQDATLFEIVKPQKQADERRLAGA